MQQADTSRMYRSRVADAVGETRFPAEKADVLAVATRHNVPSDVLAALLELPERRYASLGDVLSEVGQPPPHTG